MNTTKKRRIRLSDEEIKHIFMIIGITPFRELTEFGLDYELHMEIFKRFNKLRIEENKQDNGDE